MGWLKKIRKKAKGFRKKVKNFGGTKVGKFLKKKLVKQGLPVAAAFVPGGAAAYATYQTYEKYKGYIPKGKSRSRRKRRVSKRGRSSVSSRFVSSRRRSSRKASSRRSSSNYRVSKPRFNAVKKPKSRAGFIAGGIGALTTIAALLV